MLLALFVSNSGTALQIAAQAWFMWERTHDPQQLGLLGLVQATPLLGIPLLGGMMADAWPRRTLLLVTQTLLAAIPALMGILALAGTLSPGLLMMLAGLLSIVMALDNPVRQVYLPSVVLRSERGRIVGLNALAYNSGAVIGPALAGVLLPVGGADWCFLANSLSYLVVVTWLVRGPEGRPASASSASSVSLDAPDTSTKVRGSRSGNNKGMLALGIYLRHSPRALLMLGLVAALSLLGRSYVHILPALVSTNWGGGAAAYGTLASLPGVGAVVAAGITAWFLGRRPSKQSHGMSAVPQWHVWLMCAGALLLGCAVIALGLSPVSLLAGAVLVVVGFAATSTMTLLNAGLQIWTPDRVRGRVLSLYTILAAGMPPLGGWVLGSFIHATTPTVALITAGLMLLLLTGLIAQRLLRSAVVDDPSRA